MTQVKKRLLFLRPYLKKYRIVISIGIVFVVVSTALDQVSPWMIKTVIERFSCYQNITQQMPISNSCQEMSIQLQSSTTKIGNVPIFVWSPLFVILIVTVLSGVLLFFQRWLVICSSRQIEYELRDDLFKRLQNQPKSFMDRHKIGDIMSHATNDLDRIRDFLGPVVLHVARMPFTLVFTLTAVFILSPKLALIGIIPVFVLPFFVNRFLKKMHQLYGKIQKTLGSLNSFIQDSISGIQVIKSYAKEKTFLSKFESESKLLKNTSIKVVMLTSAMWPIIGFLSSIGILMVIWYGSSLAQNQEITLGVMMAVLLYLIKLQFPLAGLGWIANLWQRSNASMDRLIDLYEDFEPSETNNNMDSLKEPGTFNNLKLSNLVFGYSKSEPVLREINIDIKSGQSLGIVGPTGSGKTTLMHVICGIYQPSQGVMEINNKSWKSYSSSKWKSFFSITPQDGFLFSKTIEENILLGKNNSDIFTLKEVGVFSGFSKDLNQINSGYKALLGERGINLSGGQRQRVGLARAMFNNPEILCLDDTLSALDSETEAEVLINIQQKFPQKTSIIIAHKYSSIAHCDHIIYLEHGKIIEQGTHKSLLKQKGKYFQVFNKQKLSEELEKA